MDTAGGCGILSHFIIFLRSLISPQTPATCTNIALHNLYPGEIDLVVRQF
jgi:broad specificity polyphosphatase/5'/3'-nucleotidase SurE